MDSVVMRRKPEHSLLAETITLKSNVMMITQLAAHKHVYFCLLLYHFYLILSVLYDLYENYVHIAGTYLFDKFEKNKTLSFV